MLSLPCRTCEVCVQLRPKLLIERVGLYINRGAVNTRTRWLQVLKDVGVCAVGQRTHTVFMRVMTGASGFIRLSIGPMFPRCTKPPPH